MLGSEYDIVASVPSGQDALDACDNFKPALLLIDISMPGISGIAAVQVAKRRMKGLKIVVVSTHESAAYVNAARQAGAAAYLRKASLTELRTVVQTVLRGGSVWPDLRG